MAATFFILKQGIAPPELADQPDDVKLMFWRWVTDLGLKRKDAELAKGLNAHGKPLPGVRAATRTHRKSEMTPSGKGDPRAPYLMPGRGLSRTRSLLAGKAHRDYAEFFWRFDPFTGDQWGRILAHHARRGKAYDVVGISPAGIQSVAREAQKRWRLWLASGGRVEQVAVTGAAAAGRVTPVGRTNLTHAVFGAGGSQEEYQRAVAEGRATGFMTRAEWTRYWRQSAKVTAFANAGQTSASVRTGSSNVILQHIWGGGQRPAASAMAKAAMPPKAPVKPKAKAAAKPKAVARVKQPEPSTAFKPSTAVVDYPAWEASRRKAARDAVRKVLGDVSPERLASIVGAPDGATVRLFEANHGRSVVYQVQHPKIDSLQGEIRLHDDGSVVNHVHAVYVKTTEKGKGFGGAIHGRMVQYGAEHGVSRLSLNAARSKEMNGYVTWPIFGYDGPIPDEIRAELPEQLQDRTTIQELFADEEGQKWWKKHGDSVDLTFSLKVDSADVIRWTTYWAAKLLRLAGR